MALPVWLVPCLNVMIPLLLLIILGIFCCRFYIVTPKQSQSLNTFLFQICLPALAFRHIYHAGVYNADWTFVFVYMLFKICIMIFSFFVALVLVKFRITKAEFFAEFGMHFLCISFSNAIIIGQPLIVAVLGDEAAVLAILTLFADEWIVIPVSRLLFEIYESKKEIEIEMEKEKRALRRQKRLQRTQEAEAPQNKETDLHVELKEHGDLLNAIDQQQQSTSPAVSTSTFLSPSPNKSILFKILSPTWLGRKILAYREKHAKERGINWKELLHHIFLHPLVIAIVSASIYSALDLPLPSSIDKTLNMLSLTISGSALFMIGVFLYTNKVVLAGVVRALFVTFFKMIVAPFLMIFLAWLCRLHPTSAKAAVLLCAVPPAVSCFVVCNQYKIHPDVASNSLAISIILIFALVFMWIPLIEFIFGA